MDDGIEYCILPWAVAAGGLVVGLQVARGRRSTKSSDGRGPGVGALSRVLTVALSTSDGPLPGAVIILFVPKAMVSTMLTETISLAAVTGPVNAPRRDHTAERGSVQRPLRPYAHHTLAQQMSSRGGYIINARKHFKIT